MHPAFRIVYYILSRHFDENRFSGVVFNEMTTIGACSLNINGYLCVTQTTSTSFCRTNMPQCPSFCVAVNNIWLGLGGNVTLAPTSRDIACCFDYRVTCDDYFNVLGLDFSNSRLNATSVSMNVVGNLSLLTNLNTLYFNFDSRNLSGNSLNGAFEPPATVSTCDFQQLDSNYLCANTSAVSCNTGLVPCDCLANQVRGLHGVCFNSPASTTSQLSVCTDQSCDYAVVTSFVSSADSIWYNLHSAWLTCNHNIYCDVGNRVTRV
jgi:hypothetical protein